MAKKIKFCGLNAMDAVQAAATNHASFMGFIHHESSPRHISFAQMGALMQHVPEGTGRVAVMVDPDDDILRRMAAEAKPTHLQVHKVTNPARLHELTNLTGLPVIAAINVQTKKDIDIARALESHSAHILFDAAHAGSGNAFDWQLLRNVALEKSWFLAGGLTPENVAEAIAQTNAPMVDVSSGIESAAGRKSLEKIAQFYQAVLNGSHA